MMNDSKGFTLLEVLIAMLVLAIALLGLAKLQAFSMKNTGNAYFRTQATLILNQAVEVLRLNSNEECPSAGSTAPQWLTSNLPPVGEMLPRGVLTVGKAEELQPCANEINGKRCKIHITWTESTADLNADGEIIAAENTASHKSMSMSICR